MKILAIESSCDETAAAVVQDGARILSNVVVSQIDIFAEYGGVIPEVAARSHLEAILPVIHKAMYDAGNLGKDDIDAIAVTHTPGLLGSLLIGTLTARMLAILWQKPLYAVHHLKSHIYANWLKAAMPASYVTPEFPLVALVVSGGHTQLIYMRDHNQFEIIGTTRDDAVGECFDKVAKILGLPYPGGPAIDKCASGQSYTSSSEAVTLSSSKESDPRQPGDPLQTKHKTAQYPLGNSRAYRLPKPQVEGLDFSFSGLKTAVLRAVQAELGLPITTPSYELAGKLTEQQRADFAAAFQETACEILVEKLEKALEEHPEARSVVVAGGVSASAALREMVRERLLGAPQGKMAENTGLPKRELGVFFPERRFAGDNAAMVGAAAYYEIQTGVEPTDSYKLNIMPRSVIS